MAETAYLRVESLVKRFGAQAQASAAVDGVSFGVPKGRLFTLLGPSGCGKSTTLRCIAGLERPEGGAVSIDGKTVFSSREDRFVPPDRRGIGMVFQSYAIWPHMTVYQNVAYALEVKRTPKEETRTRAMDALELVGLADLAERPAPQLSGGQQQRVALARAIVGRPGLLLFDEPLSNLDAKLRERMRAEIRELQQRLQITALYVTHDQAEALAISDTIAVMEAGRILAAGAPRELYATPGSRFVADFVGSANIVRGRALGAAAGDGTAQVEVAFGVLRCRLQGAIGAGDAVDVLIRPECVAVLTTRPAAADNVWPGAVERVVFAGEVQEITLRLPSVRLRARVPPWLELRAGQPVYIEMVAQRCSAIRAQ